MAEESDYDVVLLDVDPLSCDHDHDFGLLTCAEIWNGLAHVSPLFDLDHRGLDLCSSLALDQHALCDSVLRPGSDWMSDVDKLKSNKKNEFVRDIISTGHNYKLS